MAIPLEYLQEVLSRQQAQFEASQQRLIETLTARMSLQPASTDSTVSTADKLAHSMAEFRYQPDDDLTFEAWFRRYEDLLKIDGRGLGDAAQVRLLLRKLGSQEYEKYANYILPKNPRDLSLDDTVKNLTRIFGPKTSLFNARFRCFQVVKHQDDDFVTYAAVVNRECERFQLSTLTSDQFKTLIFVCGLRSPKDAEIRTRLLSRLECNPDISLQDLVQECERLLTLKHDTEMIQRHNEPCVVDVHAIPTGPRPSYYSVRSSNFTRRNRPPSACWHCGQWHFARFCEFRQHTCKRCGKVGHKETRCLQNALGRQSRNLARTPNFQRCVSNVVFATTSPNYQSLRKYVTIMINHVPVCLQLDTASDITIISESTWCKLGKPACVQTSHVAHDASGSELPFLGQFSCEFSLRNLHANGVCYVTRYGHLNLLGIDWIDKLDLWSIPLNSICDNSDNFSLCPTDFHCSVAPVTFKNSTEAQSHFASKYPNVFAEGLGMCCKLKAVLYPRTGIRPVFCPKRPVPYAAVAAVDAELSRLESMGVISPVTYSAWAAPIVVIRKANGSLRICADFSTGLNDALETHHYPLPVPEDLFTRLNGGKIFSKIDLSDAYLQVVVEDHSKELLTINTHRGLYRYNRLPFGVKCAPAIFQQVMDAMLSGLQCAMAYLDDIIIVSSTAEDHYTHLNEVFSRIDGYGFRVRPEKCQLMMSSITYLGSIIDSSGRRPDPNKIKAIKLMPHPTNKATLQSFLGLVNYYHNFVPQMHELRAPLNALLANESVWNWSPQCQKAFDDIKQILSSDLLLTHYDPGLPIIVAADASQNGIGGVLLHQFPNGHQKAVMHVSRALTAAEKNYSQIEKEGLALVFAVKTFHKMVHGRKFILYTDHKPLLSIFGTKRGIPVHTANRLQRWATTLLAYDFDLRFKSTSSLGHADALSRLIAECTSKTPDEDSVVSSITVDPEIRQVFQTCVRQLPVTAEAVRAETATDPLLRRIMRYLNTGWPSRPLDCYAEQFRKRSFALTIIDGCLMLADRVVIPTKLQRRVLSQFHEGHPGISRMKSIARSYAYWPFMDQDIENVVRSCSSCAMAAKLPVKCELHSWPIPNGPWSRIHIDFAGPIEGFHYLIIVDAYSKWPEIFQTRYATTSIVLLHLRHLISEFGVPEKIVSDNASQFTSQEFADFCHSHGIEHIRSPAYHPQSNGQAERFVDTFKRALIKMEGEGNIQKVIDKFLQIYRTTPGPAVPQNLSPSEAFLGRRVRTVLDALKPVQNNGQRNAQMELAFNRHHGARPRHFMPGDNVYVKNFRDGKSSWIPGRIVERVSGVLYKIQVDSVIWTRHVNHIRPRVEVQGTSQRRETSLPLDILLDTYQLGPSEEPVAQTENAPTNRRYSTRTRAPVQRLVVNPRCRAYESNVACYPIFSKGGRC
ncbi:unnamed protein product [Dicrocoelium dendriticum]|nr:unnamed protein product [Dicrocoelium dendriticum]